MDLPLAAAALATELSASEKKRLSGDSRARRRSKTPMAASSRTLM